MKKLKKYISYLASPVFVGVLTTTLVVYVAHSFYEARATPGFNWEKNWLLKVIHLADLKSTDLRLQARGPRQGSPRVALLSVDEKAVSTIGRWPWPREKIAFAVDKAVELGSTVLAFDMVFAEDSDNPAKTLYNTINEKAGLSPEAHNVAKQVLKKFDSDQLLAQSFKRNSQKIVLGTFFNNPVKTSDPKAGFRTACHDLIYRASPAASIWEKEAALPAVFDNFTTELNESMNSLYLETLKEIENKVRIEYGSVSGVIDNYRLQETIIDDKAAYCAGWLEDKYDPLNELFREPETWAALKSQEEYLEENSFDEWSNNFRSAFRANLVTHTLSWVTNTATLSKSLYTEDEHYNHTGFFNAELDADGTIRRSPVIVNSGLSYFPSISLKAFLLANNYTPSVTIGESKYSEGFKGIQKLEIRDSEYNLVKTIPVTESGHLRINYAGSDRMFPHVSLAELFTDAEDMEVEYRYVPSLNNHVPNCTDIRKYPDVDGKRICKVNKKSFFKDKIFIVGATAIGIFDLRVTPFEENYPGAETHANVIDNLVRDDYLVLHPDESLYMILVIIGIGLMLAIALGHMGAINGMLLTIFTIVGVALIDKYYLFGNGILVSVIFVLVAIVSSYVVITFYKYFTEERNKRELRSTFSKYVSPSIVNEILEDPENIELGGRKENITVFFSDIRGFTTISEKLDPRALSDLLNSYLTPMTDLVFENRGTLDKYMGDAIMAFFGAPIHYNDHAKHACRCALQQLEKLKELQAQYAEKGLPMIDVGIGLNTGECSVGNMGSESVRSYTVMGDAVNLGSRLEGINKQYGTRIIISEFTYADVKDDFICREIDWVRVKGKVLPVKIYELVSENKLPDQMAEVIDLFKTGYGHYHKRGFKEAVDCFSKALNINPADACSQLYLKRCQDYIETPPPADWDGVFVMTTK